MYSSPSKKRRHYGPKPKVAEKEEIYAVEKPKILEDVSDTSITLLVANKGLNIYERNQLRHRVSWIVQQVVPEGFFVHGLSKYSPSDFSKAVKAAIGKIQVFEGDSLNRPGSELIKQAEALYEELDLPGVLKRFKA